MIIKQQIFIFRAECKLVVQTFVQMDKGGVFHLFLALNKSEQLFAWVFAFLSHEGIMPVYRPSLFCPD